ncbi:MAG: VanW family protein [Bacillota bacterium]
MFILKKYLGLPAGRIFAGTIIIILFTLALFEYYYSLNRAPLGLYLGETYIGGKSYKQIEAYFMEFENIKLLFSLPEQNFVASYQLQELGICFDREKTMQEIKTAGKPFIFRNKLALLRSSGHIFPYYKVNELVFNTVLEELESCIKVEERDAEVWAEGGALTFKPHRHGIYLQKEGFSAALLAKLSQRPGSSQEFPLTLIRREAEITVSAILEKGIKDKLYTATTVFNPADKNRVHNIILAAEQVNNIILKPGDVFSFNKLVGDANQERGYKEAPIIVNDQLVMGAGGGICQVSSTIYNAALMTGMVILERHNHGLPVAYLPPGLDATVVYDHLDLKFANQLLTHVLLHMEVEDNHLHATIFGNPHAVDKIGILRKDLVQIPAPQHYRVVDGRPSWYREIIQEGKPGYAVETIRIFYSDGEEVKRESLGKDYYAPVPYIYAVGNIPDG